MTLDSTRLRESYIQRYSFSLPCSETSHITSPPQQQQHQVRCKSNGSIIISVLCKISPPVTKDGCFRHHLTRCRQFPTQQHSRTRFPRLFGSNSSLVGLFNVLRALHEFESEIAESPLLHQSPNDHIMPRTYAPST